MPTPRDPRRRLSVDHRESEVLIHRLIFQYVGYVLEQWCAAMPRHRAMILVTYFRNNANDALHGPIAPPDA